eukprot:m.58799 g.58799  ORF g.58799 m.58799 type:complete len:423 (+) comp34829_c0_seq1:408-1676(+)
MAHTARDDDDKKELFDPPDIVNEKVTRLAKWVKSAKHFIAFTGAGISTAAGIPDFRSGMGTVLKTGPGVWELKAKKKGRSSSHKTIATTKAIPTPTHMLMVKLCQEGILKAVVSQNTDGLHRRSGIAKKDLFELHGNSNLEKCSKCHREYLRDFRTRSAAKVHDHKTGRLCDDLKCRGVLKDSIINFGEDLPDDAFDGSTNHAEKADLCLAMGSSLTVTPAADIPESVGGKKIKEGGLVIVNLQRTPLDALASMRINAKCEEVAKLLAEKLELVLPEFRLKRKLKIGHQLKPPGNIRIFVKGLSADNLPYSYLQEVEFNLPKQLNPIPPKTAVTVKREPFEITNRLPPGFSKLSSLVTTIKVTFFGHYEEPPLEFTHNLSNKDSSKIVDLEYNPFCKQWNQEKEEEASVQGLAAGISKLAVS